MGVKIEKAISWAVAIANDNSHGYSQSNRWGPHYDCSSFLITAYQNAGVPVKTNGASNTRDMYNAFIKSGFSNVKSKVNVSNGSGLIKGDVLLTPADHTVMFIGNGKIVHASTPASGILVANYYSYSWTYVLRYNEAPITTEGEFDMVCCYKLHDINDGTVYYFDGVKVRALRHSTEYDLLKVIYKGNTGKEMPLHSWNTQHHNYLQNLSKY